MKKIMASMLALLGINGAAAQESGPQLMDPSKILFTVPTISNDMAPLDPVTQPPTGTVFSFHEDDWAQVEFFPKSQFSEVQRLLTEYKPFEANNRVRYGWKNTYVRKIERVTVVPGGSAPTDLSTLLGASVGPAPILFTSNAISGRVSSGFSIPLGGNVTLYGYSTNSGIPVLGAMVGENPDDQKLVQAFYKLNSKYGLILVDWRQQLVIAGHSPDGALSVWRP